MVDSRGDEFMTQGKSGLACPDHDNVRGLRHAPIVCRGQCHPSPGPFHDRRLRFEPGRLLLDEAHLLKDAEPAQRPGRPLASSGAE
jgi:hypothetical protein